MTESLAVIMILEDLFNNGVLSRDELQLVFQEYVNKGYEKAA